MKSLMLEEPIGMTLNSVLYGLWLSFSEYVLNKNANTYQVVLQNSACGH